MSKTITVNKFEVKAWEGGYPVWTEIKYDGKTLVRIHHKEVKDLEYCLQRIRAEIAPLLGKDSHEA